MSSQMWVRMAGYQNYITYMGRKLNNLMWLRMAGYRKYISYRYVFISSLVSLTKYAGQKLNNLMWLSMAGEFMFIYFFGYALSSQLWLHMAGYRKYLSSIYVFYLLFCFTEKVHGTKTEHYDVANYGGRIHVYIFFRVRLFG